MLLNPTDLVVVPHVARFAPVTTRGVLDLFQLRQFLPCRISNTAATGSKGVDFGIAPGHAGSIVNNGRFKWVALHNEGSSNKSKGSSCE